MTRLFLVCSFIVGGGFVLGFIAFVLSLWVLMS